MIIRFLMILALALMTTPFTWAEEAAEESVAMEEAAEAPAEVVIEGGEAELEEATDEDMPELEEPAEDIESVEEAEEGEEADEAAEAPEAEQ